MKQVPSITSLIKQNIIEQNNERHLTFTMLLFDWVPLLLKVERPKDIFIMLDT